MHSALLLVVQCHRDSLKSESESNALRLALSNFFKVSQLLGQIYDTLLEEVQKFKCRTSS